ncbi:MAG: hypothetical protein ABFC94_00450 [Syntrophomonas sp.]
MINTTAVPNTTDFRPLFWDTDINTIDSQKNKKQIIQRILNFGNERTYQWMFQTYSVDDVIGVVKYDKNVSPRSAVMIANYYNISKEEIACLKNALKPNYFPF